MKIVKRFCKDCIYSRMLTGNMKKVWKGFDVSKIRKCVCPIPSIVSNRYVSRIVPANEFDMECECWKIKKRNGN